jgi:hypothetical protein
MNGLALWANSPLSRIAIVWNAQHDRCSAIFAMFDAGSKHDTFSSAQKKGQSM